MTCGVAVICMVNLFNYFYLYHDIPSTYNQLLLEIMSFIVSP